MDVESVRRWWDYTKTYQVMLEATNTASAPWQVVPADDKRRARLNLISHMLSKIPHKKVRVDLPKIPRGAPRPKGVEARLRAGRWCQIFTNRGPPRACCACWRVMKAASTQINS